jgi:thiamine biosynthesis lipoprotein
MRKLFIAAAVLFLALPLSSCQKVQEHRAEFFVFGTLVEVVVRDADRETTDKAFAELQQRFQQMHRDWHAWEPGALDNINQAFAAGRQVQVQEDIRDLINKSRELEILSGGRFNATVGGLVRLWGFHTSTFPVTGPIPEQLSIHALIEASPSAVDIVFNGDWVRSQNPAVQLDFGGIAKGYAVDLAMGILATHGIENALINAGGDLLAAGGTSKNPWSVGIRRPGGGVLGGIEIKGTEAVFTSGIDQRFLEQSELRYPHVLDPHTGQAVQGVSSVTVISQQGYFADAAATALMVAGSESWKEVAAALGLELVLLIDNQGNLIMTPAMENRLILEQN